MKDGWIRVGADCPAITVADPQGNAATLASAARRAAAEGGGQRPVGDRPRI